MALLQKNDARRSVSLYKGNMIPSAIIQHPSSYAQINLGEKRNTLGCLRCLDEKCLHYRDDEIQSTDFPDYSFERNNKVCPVDAIHWDFRSELPEIDSNLCIGCALCASRCPSGAIRIVNHMATILKPSENTVRLPIIDSTVLEEHYAQMLALDAIKCVNRRFVVENDAQLSHVYDVLTGLDGRSMIPNIFVRNILIGLGYKCAIRRAGDVYTRIDSVYSGHRIWPKTRGAIEIEFGRDTLEASRGILDDIAVLHSRNGIDKETNTALVVCLSFPNKRQGYYQVVKDIKNVVNIKIQTLSVGALLILLWNGASPCFDRRDFYVDFDDVSIRETLAKCIGRSVNISDGFLGILEPEK